LYRLGEVMMEAWRSAINFPNVMHTRGVFNVLKLSIHHIIICWICEVILHEQNFLS